MKNQIYINPKRSLSTIDRNIFGGFAEHLERCIYGGIYDPDSPLADDRGLRTDVMDALRRLNMPVMRYPGGNFVSGYRWIDGVGPRNVRPVRTDMAWHAIDPNTFGTNEFVDFCRAINTTPYMVVNCGDGSMREARDWVEYCNGTQPTALVKLRQQHGYEEPHKIPYWGIGNEVDGPWQIGYKTPTEYARAVTEFGKVMKWADPDIKLIANGVTNWDGNDFVERCQLIMEQSSTLIDYIALHWYVDNPNNDFAEYMAISELIDQRLTAYEGLMKAMILEQQITRPIHIAVDEWNVWHRAQMDVGGHDAVVFTLEDAMAVAMHLNAFVRHSSMVRMANIAQIVNVIAPIFTKTDGMFLQSIFYPFEMFSKLCGPMALDINWEGETFSSGDLAGIRNLDVSATLNPTTKELVVFAINRTTDQSSETSIKLSEGQFTGAVKIHTISGADIKTFNCFDTPGNIVTQISKTHASGQTLNYAFEPHSITALVCQLT